jgi:hypothetical protein
MASTGGGCGGAEELPARGVVVHRAVVVERHPLRYADDGGSLGRRGSTRRPGWWPRIFSNWRRVSPLDSLCHSGLLRTRLSSGPCRASGSAGGRRCACVSRFALAGRCGSCEALLRWRGVTLGLWQASARKGHARRGSCRCLMAIFSTRMRNHRCVTVTVASCENRQMTVTVSATNMILSAVCVLIRSRLSAQVLQVSLAGLLVEALVGMDHACANRANQV